MVNYCVCSGCKTVSFLLCACACIIYNLLLLKISLVESQQAQIAEMSADSEVFGSLYKLLADR